MEAGAVYPKFVLNLGAKPRLNQPNALSCAHLMGGKLQRNTDTPRAQAAQVMHTTVNITSVSLAFCSTSHARRVKRTPRHSTAAGRRQQ
jgi:hypothetical protein